MGYKTYTCPIARECGGCEWLAVPYPLQLRRKQEQVEALFGEVAAADGATLEPVVGVEGEPLAYRHKAATPFAPGPKGRIRHGFYQRGSHRIVRCDSCLVEAPRAREILAEVARVAGRLRIPAYDEDSGRGVLRHAVVRMGWKTGEALLTVVTNGRELRRAEEFATELHRRCPELVGIVQNVNTRRTNAILGRESHVLWGAGVMHDELLGCRFEIGPTSFYQTNPAQTEVLYRLAIEAAAPGQGDRLLDAYCGTGTIGICAATLAREMNPAADALRGTAAQGAGLREVPAQGRRSGARERETSPQGESLREAHYAPQVIGVDSVPGAIACAKRNAQANDLAGQCTYVATDATKWMQKAAFEQRRIDVVLMDPPRAGSTPEFLRGVCELAPRRVVYVSCNPETQLRDLATLREGGYHLVRLTPVDMFPHTKHVETVALLERG